MALARLRGTSSLAACCFHLPFPALIKVFVIVITITMLLSRLAFAKGVLLSSLTSTSTTSTDDVVVVEPSIKTATLQDMNQPTSPSHLESHYYMDNPTVFGKILRGEINSTLIFAETPDVLAFQDLRPRAPLHALVIPKRFIPSVFDISYDDLDLLEEMHQTAVQVMQTHQPEALESSDYLLVFHVPPYNSVNHLHLHVLAPASSMNWLYTSIKYNTRTRWCTSWEAVVHRLRRKQPAVPYRRPSRLASSIP